MDLTQIIILALLQGLTEFLPVSSSAHLIMLPLLTDWPDQGLAFDVAVHFGSLLAVATYFRQDLRDMARAWIGSMSGAGMPPAARLAWVVLLATIPVGLAGLMLRDYIEIATRSVQVIAWASIIFALLLGLAEWLGTHRRELEAIRWYDVLLIGVSQTLALIPGVSRSGVVVTAALASGLTRIAAVRFSFLLAVPVIILATGLKTWDLLREPYWVRWPELLLGISLSAMSAYLCIHFFLRLVEKIGMWPFVLYRLVLGLVLLRIFI